MRVCVCVCGRGGGISYTYLAQGVDSARVGRLKALFLSDVSRCQRDACRKYASD